MTTEAVKLATRVREHLKGIAYQAEPITYQALARELQLAPPNTIRQLTKALELLMQEDTARGHPFITALVIGKSHGGLPAPGFFQMAAQLKQYDGDMTQPDMVAYHAREFHAAVRFWQAPEN